MSDYQAYDGNTEEWVDLRECTDTELIGWLDASNLAGDDIVRDDVTRLLNERGVPGWWTYGYDDEGCE